MQIKKAVILSAGYGKRLNPITLSKPKPLIEINNTTKVTFEADYVLPYYIIGVIIDRIRLRKYVIKGMYTSLQEVKNAVEEKHKEEITIESTN